MISAGAAPWLFCGGSLVGAWFTYNALGPYRRAARRSVASFFAGWLTTELALHHFVWQLLLTAVFVWAGALAAWPGVAGLAITLASWAGLAQCYRVARGAEAVVEQALCDGLGRSYREEIFPEVREKFAPAIDWRQILLPLPVWHPGVERVRNVVYDRVDEKALALDVYRPRAEMSGCPTLLQIHGGGRERVAVRAHPRRRPPLLRRPRHPRHDGAGGRSARLRARAPRGHRRARRLRGDPGRAARLRTLSVGTEPFRHPRRRAVPRLPVQPISRRARRRDGGRRPRRGRRTGLAMSAEFGV